MKLHNARSTWTLEGMQIYKIPPNRRLTMVEMSAIYPSAQPASQAYRRLAVPSRYERLVVLKPAGTMVLVPMTPDVQIITTEDT